MTIMTAYRPCKDSLTTATTATTGTVLMQQYRELQEIRGVDAPYPWKQFLQDLTTNILQLQSDGHAILLRLDANISQPDNKFDTFLDKCELQDFLAEKYPNLTTTHSKGNHLDLILGCNFVASHVIAVSILDSSHGPETDHAVLYVDLGTSIFNKKNKAPTSLSQRGFWIQDGAHTKRFQERVNTALEQNEQLYQLNATLNPVLIETFVQCH